MECPVCLEACNDGLCVCGYSFEDGKVVDWEMLKTCLATKARGPWPARIRLVEAATRLGGLSGRHTAKNLGLSSTQHHRTVKLANALAMYTQLAGCCNEDAARRRLRSLRAPHSNQYASEVGAFESEEDLQKFLELHWDTTSLGKEWKLYKPGHVDTHEIGIMDLLAKHRTRPSWLVVELKVRKTSDEALGQVLRYMGWVKHKLAAENDAVEGLVISGETDPQIWYGLKCVPNVRMLCYRRQEDALNLFEVQSPEFVRAMVALDDLDEHQRLSLLQKLQEQV